MSFCWKLANTTFTTLKNFHIVLPAQIDEVILLIKNLLHLERLTFTKLRNYNRQATIKQLNQ